jgi:hypothetical protein
MSQTQQPFAILNASMPVVPQHVPQTGTNENNQCGEACVAMEVGYVYGPARMPTAQQVSDDLKAGGLVTGAQQLNAYELAKYGIATTTYLPTSMDGLTWEVWNNLRVGKICRILQRYSDAVAEDHWREVFGLTQNMVLLADSWAGMVIRQDYPMFWKLYAASSSGRCLTSIDTLPQWSGLW